MILVLFLLWLIFNGKITVEIVATGVAVTALIYAFMWKFLAWSLKKDVTILRFAWFIVSYAAILIIEIIKAVLATTSVMFNEREDIVPVVVKFDSDIESGFFNVILANSITMTPGTITVSLEENHFTVHALDESFAVGIDESVFVDRLRQADKMLKIIKNKEADK